MSPPAGPGLTPRGVRTLERSRLRRGVWVVARLPFRWTGVTVQRPPHSPRSGCRTSSRPLLAGASKLRDDFWKLPKEGAGCAHVLTWRTSWLTRRPRSLGGGPGSWSAAERPEGGSCVSILSEDVNPGKAATPLPAALHLLLLHEAYDARRVTAVTAPSLSRRALAPRPRPRAAAPRHEQRLRGRRHPGPVLRPDPVGLRVPPLQAQVRGSAARVTGGGAGAGCAARARARCSARPPPSPRLPNPSARPSTVPLAQAPSLRPVVRPGALGWFPCPGRREQCRWEQRCTFL